MQTLSNNDNARWISDNHGLLIPREKKHEHACSCFYRHCNLKSYTVLNLVMKRTNLLYWHFTSSISSFVLQKFDCSVFAAVSVNS